MRVLPIASFMAVTMLGAAHAEYADYGAVELTGLSRESSWPYNAPGETYAMVCNVNGPDGFLSVREGPGTGYGVARNLKRLAIVTVETRLREGNWVLVNDAHRAFSPDGDRLAKPRSLFVQGWAHDGYLCDFIDY